ADGRHPFLSVPARVGNDRAARVAGDGVGGAGAPQGAGIPAGRPRADLAAPLRGQRSRVTTRSQRSRRAFSGSVPTITPEFVKCRSRSTMRSCVGHVGRPAPLGSVVSPKLTQ